jgi:DnaJ-domain-containing protein 1
MPYLADLAPQAALTYLAVAIALIGALFGTAGFAFTVVRRQTKRTTALLDLLASATDARHLASADGVHDPKLRASLRQLAERLTEV